MVKPKMRWPCEDIEMETKEEEEEGAASSFRLLETAQFKVAIQAGRQLLHTT